MQHHYLERDIYFPFYKITSVKLIRFAHEKKLRMSYLLRNSQLILFTALGLAKFREDKNISPAVIVQKYAELFTFMIKA